MLTSLNDRQVARGIILIIKAPILHREGVLRELTVLVLWTWLSWNAGLLGLLFLVGPLLRLDAVTVSELLLLDRLTHLEHVADSLEECLILMTRESSGSICTNRRSPLTRNPSRGGGIGSVGSTVLGPRVAPKLGSNIWSRSRRSPIQITLQHTNWVQGLRNVASRAHSLNQCLNEGSIDQ